MESKTYIKNQVSSEDWKKVEQYSKQFPDYYVPLYKDGKEGNEIEGYMEFRSPCQELNDMDDNSDIVVEKERNLESRELERIQERWGEHV